MTRAYGFVILAGIVALVLQTSLFPFLFARRLYPDLILVMVVLLGLFRDPVHGACMAFLLGGMEDYFTEAGQVKGLFLFSRTLIFILANLLRRRFSVHSPGAQFTFVLGFSVLDKILIYLLVLWFGAAGAAAVEDWPFRALETAVNAALAPFFFILMSWAPGLFEGEGDRSRSWPST